MPQRDCIAELTSQQAFAGSSLLTLGLRRRQPCRKSDEKQTINNVTVSFRKCKRNIIDFQLNSMPNKVKDDKKADGKKEHTGKFWNVETRKGLECVMVDHFQAD